MRLLLTSQGIQKEIKKDFLELLTKSPDENKVLCITTAAWAEHNHRPEWLNIYIKQLNDCGIKSIKELDIRDKSKEELKKVVANIDIILVNGGNPYFLLYWLKKSGFDEIVKKHIKENRLYIGISAGSYVACPTVEQGNWRVQERNKFGLTNLSALNLVPFLVTAHFREENRAKIEAEVKKTKYPVVALTDQQAVLVVDNQYKVIGPPDRQFYNGFSETM